MVEIFFRFAPDSKISVSPRRRAYRERKRRMTKDRFGNAHAPGRHGDGGGLYLVVSDAGSRKWVLRFQVNGKRRDIGLGSATSVSLADAREAVEDTYAKTAQAKLYKTKTPITAADMLNDKVLPFHEEHDLPVLRILTDRGTEYCGRADRHDYQLFLAINDIEHTKTKVRSPQTNGICERFHKTILQEFYQVTFRKKIYETIEQLQIDLDQWIDYYNNERTHQGKVCEGRTPMQTLLDGKRIWKEKFVG